MVRIPVDIAYFAGGLRPMLKVVLRFDNPRIFLPVNAIIDTGSPTTLIGFSDLRRMRLSSLQIKKLLGKKEEINIGGGKMQTVALEGMNFKVGNYLETSLDVKFPLSGEDEKQPTLLGVDFLEKIKANFYFNPDKRESYIEILD